MQGRLPVEKEVVYLHMFREEKANHHSAVYRTWRRVSSGVSIPIDERSRQGARVRTFPYYTNIADTMLGLTSLHGPSGCGGAY